MSEFDIIIPIAIILLVALASGGGGSSSKSRIIQPPEDKPPFEAQVGNVFFPDLDELYNEDFEKENQSESSLVGAEQDFTKSRAIWRQSPDNGNTLLKIARETLTKCYFALQELEKANIFA